MPVHGLSASGTVPFRQECHERRTDRLQAHARVALRECPAGAAAASQHQGGHLGTAENPERLGGIRHALRRWPGHRALHLRSRTPAAAAGAAAVAPDRVDVARYRMPDGLSLRAGRLLLQALRADPHALGGDRGRPAGNGGARTGCGLRQRTQHALSGQEGLCRGRLGLEPGQSGQSGPHCRSRRAGR